MSESDESIDEVFDKLFRDLELHGHSFPIEYRDSIKEALRKSGVNCVLTAFTQKMMTRQGTHLPDFDALYKYKADLDKRLMPPTPPAPQA